MQARWRESAAQGLAGAWVARLGFVAFGLAVLWLAAGAAPGCGRGAVSMHAAFGVCERFHVVRLDVFGSALRDDFEPGRSDVDVLVDFGPMSPLGKPDAYFGLLDELRAILGSDVDLVMVGALKNRYIREDVNRTKRVLYAA